VPKQYCALRGGRSLLRLTMARAERLVPDDRVVAVVQRDHRSWWSRELSDLPRENVVAQPGDRGTAVGLLLALLAIRRRDPEAEVVVLPADHFVAREDLFAEGVEVAFGELGGARDRVVLLGVASGRPDGGLGWIVPAAESAAGAAQPVAEFCEKPTPALARALIDRGAVANCFVSVGRLETFVRLLGQRCDALALLEPLFAGARLDGALLAAAFERLSRVDLSADVLAHHPGDLSVLALPELGWSDLGTPEGVQRCLLRHRVPALPATDGRRAPVDLSAPRPRKSLMATPAPELARYTEML
jgi:mannose-1-phosphate guanylyltransferase